MKRTFKRIGLVSLVVLVAFLVMQPAGLGHTWEDTKNWDHDDVILPADWDGVQEFTNHNGNDLSAQCSASTGGTYGSPESINDVNGKYLVFGTWCTLNLYWGEDDPDRPEDCTLIWVSASLMLYREVTPNNWQLAASDQLVTRLTRTTDGEDNEEIYFHAVEDRDYQHNDMYYLNISVSGGWEDDSVPPVNTVLQNLVTTVYYKIN